MRPVDSQPPSQAPARSPAQAPLPPLSPPLATLLAQVSYRAPSLIVTIWGDTIAPTGAAVWLRGLIGLAGDFGLTERGVRTAMFRLQRDGWLQSTQKGRRSLYRLTPAGERLTGAADARIYGRAAPAWDGGWTTLILEPGRADAKERLARELRLLGFGAVAGGVFVRPGAEAADARELIADLGCGGDATVLSGQTGEADLPALRGLVARAWDHAAIHARYAGFVSVFAPLEAVAGKFDAREAFIFRTLLIHEFRRITLRDPMLPARLLPPGDARTGARELAARLYWPVAAAAAQWAGGLLETEAGRLPKPGAAYYRRFGGD